MVIFTGASFCGKKGVTQGVGRCDARFRVERENASQQIFHLPARVWECVCVGACTWRGRRSASSVS